MAMHSRRGRLLAAMWCCVPPLLSMLLATTSARAVEISLHNGEYSLAREKQPSLILPPVEGKTAFDRIMDPAHLTFTGLGPAGDKALTVDRDGPEEFFTVLGRTPRLPDFHPESPMFAYVSSRPGDSTMLLTRATDCPDPCARVFWIRLQRDGEDVPYPCHAHRTSGLGGDAATASGLRLGMTPDEVRAVLGPTPAEADGSLYYQADYGANLPREEILARGWPERYAEKSQLITRIVKITFRDDRAASIFVMHGITWD